MNIKNLLVLCGLVLGSSACMGQPKPAPDTSPLPDAASIASHSAVEARRLEAERRSGVIFETSRPGRLLVDGQAPGVDSSSEKSQEPESVPDRQEESVPVIPAESEEEGDSVEEGTETELQPEDAHD